LATLEGDNDRKRRLLDLEQAWLSLANYTERHPHWQSQFVTSDLDPTEDGQILKYRAFH
jgi:hypothetical protein